jgi:hypothetical protein
MIRHRASIYRLFLRNFLLRITLDLTFWVAPLSLSIYLSLSISVCRALFALSVAQHADAALYRDKEGGSGGAGTMSNV